MTANRLRVTGGIRRNSDGNTILTIIGKNRHDRFVRKQWIARSILDLDPDRQLGKSVRLVILFVLMVLPFSRIFLGLAEAIAGGAPMAYLAVLPVLTAMIALGYRIPPRGVGDPESDWILAAVFGGLGLFLRHLMSNRFPTLSGLWHLPMVGAVLWAACLAAILFGVRRVMQTWALWVFAVVTATPLPYLLCTAAMGGGPLAIAAVTGALGGVAVILAGRLSPLGWRLGTGAACAVFGAGAGVAIAGTSVESSNSSSLVLVLLAGGVFPVAGFVVLQRRAAMPESLPVFSLPRRSPMSLVALCVGAALVFVLNEPFGKAPAAPAVADANWVERLGLPTTQSFPFIKGFLGPETGFVRHPVRSLPGSPEAAVDVITADNLETLRTYSDAIWYPATVPPNYRRIGIGNPAITDARAAATDSSLATSAHALDWYVVSWTWQTSSSYQQIFVVVNQTWTSQEAPPVAGPLSLRANVIGPALWLARQQADPSTKVDRVVVARAQQIIDRILNAGRPRHG